MANVVSVSSKGQIVIPKEIREALGIVKGEKFIIVGDKNTILLKKIEEDRLKKKMVKLLDYFADKFAEAEVTKKDVEVEIAKARKR